MIMIRLGNIVKDSITGFTGMAVGRTEWLYGCTRIAVESTELKDGKPVGAEWFDEQRIEVVVASVPKVSADSAATTGGPQRDPGRSADPAR
jgi:hypothetical protein